MTQPTFTAEAREVEPNTDLAYREFNAQITPGEGRTVDVRVVPYGEIIEHNDGLGGVPAGVVYREEVAYGAFAHQLNAANRVLVNVEHEPGLAGVVGHGLALREIPGDGLHGSFKLHETPAGDKALLLVREGVLQTVSLEARFTKSIRTAEGIIRRVKADLKNVALTRFGAYKGAVVLGVREQPVMFDETLLPLPWDNATLERCRALGISFTVEHKAHPA